MARRLLDRGMDCIRKNGLEEAFRSFSRQDGGFVSDSLYLFVLDFDGLVLAHGGNPGLVGRPLLNLRDSKGHAFIQDFIESARTQGDTWFTYWWYDPLSKQEKPKMSLIRRIPGVDALIGCGYYLD